MVLGRISVYLSGGGNHDLGFSAGLNAIAWQWSDPLRAGARRGG